MGWIHRPLALVLPSGPSIVYYVLYKKDSAKFLYINVSEEEFEGSLREEI